MPGVYRTQVNDVLLSALGRVLADWAGTDRVTVALEGHGREEIDGTTATTVTTAMRPPLPMTPSTCPGPSAGSPPSTP